MAQGRAYSAADGKRQAAPRMEAILRPLPKWRHYRQCIRTEL